MWYREEIHLRCCSYAIARHPITVLFFIRGNKLAKPDHNKRNGKEEMLWGRRRIAWTLKVAKNWIIPWQRRKIPIVKCEMRLNWDHEKGLFSAVSKTDQETKPEKNLFYFNEISSPKNKRNGLSTQGASRFGRKCDLAEMTFARVELSQRFVTSIEEETI